MKSPFALLEQKYSPFPSGCHHWRSPAPRLCSPGTTNLRSSAFICGLFFAGAPDSKDSDRINRMDRINSSTKSLYEKSINSIFMNEPQRTQRARRFFKRISVFSSVALTFQISPNPVNPVHPVQSGSSFSAAPDINRYEFIKVRASQNPSPQSHHIPPPCAGSEPVLRWTKSSIRERTWMTRIGRIFTDFLIRGYPCHPCNPCSATASFFVGAPQINISRFIKPIASQKPSSLLLSKFSAPGLISEGFIHNTFSGLGTTLYTDRMKSSYVRGNA